MIHSSYYDPCICEHSYEDHDDSDLGGCNVLDCKCNEYTADTSWTDDLDEQDMLDQENSDT
jgi:hypothetical protein